MATILGDEHALDHGAVREPEGEFLGTIRRFLHRGRGKAAHGGVIGQQLVTSRLIPSWEKSTTPGRYKPGTTSVGPLGRQPQNLRHTRAAGQG